MSTCTQKRWKYRQKSEDLSMIENPCVAGSIPALPNTPPTPKIAVKTAQIPGSPRGLPHAPNAHDCPNISRKRTPKSCGRIVVPKALRGVEQKLFKTGTHDFAYVYFLMLGDVLVYVGQTVAMAPRLNTHRREGRRFDSAYFILTTPQNAELLESKYIAALKPLGNSRLSSSTRRVNRGGGEVADGTVASRKSRRLSRIEKCLDGLETGGGGL
jgi:hypothetical protein